MSNHQRYPAPQQVTTADRSSYRVPLIVTHASATNPANLTLQLSDSIEGIRQARLAEWAITGVALSGGTPTQAYLAVDVGGLFPRVVDAASESSGLKIFPTGAADRAVYQDFVTLTTDTPLSLKKVQTWKIRRPDGTDAQVGDYSQIMLRFDLWVDKQY